MAVKETLRIKAKVWGVVSVSLLLVIVVEVFVYFFLRQAREMLSSMGAQSYIYMIIAPLVAIAEKIYVPALIEALGLPRLLVLMLVILTLFLLVYLRDLKLKTMPARIEGYTYLGPDDLTGMGGCAERREN